MTDYVKSHAYEAYITLARLCDRDSKFRAHNQYMINLMDTEKGKFYIKGMTQQKCLDYVKNNLISATKFALKRKFDKADKEIFKDYLKRFSSSTTSIELLDICSEGIEVLLKYKPIS